jgi:hypothetical protein
MKDFAPYQQSLELKELGFDEECLALFSRDKSLLIKQMPNQQECEQYFGGVLAPTFSQAFRWFREKGLHSAILPKMTPSNNVVYYMYEGKPKKNWDNCFETYEEAELECLIKLIQIVKTK